MPGSSGEAYVQGLPLASQAAQIRRHVGYMPEHNPLPEDVTVRDYLTFRAQLKGLSSRAAKLRVAKLADLCDLSGRPMRRPIGVLSRGVRQRVGIAEALLASPSVLFLDEPTIGLDPHQVIALRELIVSMRGEHTILVSTHILSEAEAIADRVLIINKGEQVAFGTPDELRRSYQTQEHWAFEVTLPRAQFEKFVEKFSAKIIRVDVHKDYFRYELAFAPEGAPKLLAAELVAHEGACLVGLGRIVPSLETIFIEATAAKEGK
jgi:ABC-2 type transport system ATP-binding protein